jgi:hypothetical protein
MRKKLLKIKYHPQIISKKEFNQIKTNKIFNKMIKYKVTHKKRIIINPF